MRKLNPILAGLAKKHSPPPVMIALALHLNRLGRAHIWAGVLTAEDVRPAHRAYLSIPSSDGTTPYQEAANHAR